MDKNVSVHWCRVLNFLVVVFFFFLFSVLIAQWINIVRVVCDGIIGDRLSLSLGFLFFEHDRGNVEG
jgi:hypothetical protein